MKVLLIHNKRQLLDLIGQLNTQRLPFKIAIQDIYPDRTLESNAYLWGIVYETIGQSTGQSAKEVHEGYKKKYNFRYDLNYNNRKKTWVWKMGVGSTTTLDMQEIWEYIMKVRADAEIEIGVTIPMPNEVFVNELEFAKEVWYDSRNRIQPKEKHETI